MRAETEPKTEIPASIVPVLILSGSDYQMGYQYGEQAARHFGMRLDENWVEILKQFSHEEVLRELEVSEKYIKQYAPESIDMMKGIANGATSAGYKMSYIDVLLLNTRPRRTVPEEEDLGATGCSGFAAWGSSTKDGRLICGSSADSPMNPNVAMVVFPDKGNNYMAMSMHVGALISHPGMNNRGLVYVHHGGGARGPALQSGLPGFIAVAHILRFTDNANDAKDMQLSYTSRAGGQWVDIHGNGWVIERNEPEAIRRDGDYGETDFIYSTNNALCRELEQEGQIYTEHGGWYARGRWGRCAVSRNLEIWNMLHNYRGKVDLDFAKMMWRFPGNPPPYPRDASSYIATNGEGWDTMICHLLNKYVTVILPDDGDKGKMYVCTGPAGRVAYPVDPNGYSFQTGATHTFYEVTLGSSPATVVGAAKSAASSRLAEAYDKLMWLNYIDTGYEALNELFSLANSEYWQGSIAYNKGLLTGGNEMLLYFSESATAFARSQAHAKQVLHSFVPPATCPSDLVGLEDKPWFGDWGEWATR